MAYRDELDAARARREALKRELDGVTRALDSMASLSSRKSDLEASLADADRSVDHARSKVALPLLSSVRIASPCHAQWEEMDGDDRARHCGACDKKVYDLSAMRAEQAEALLREHGQSACVRLFRRADGTVMTSDCPVGERRARRRRLAIAATATTLLAGGAFAMAAGSATMGAPAPMMGEAVYVPPPADVGQVEMGPPPSAPTSTMPTSTMPTSTMPTSTMPPPVR